MKNGTKKLKIAGFYDGVENILKGKNPFDLRAKTLYSKDGTNYYNIDDFNKLEESFQY